MQCVAFAKMSFNVFLIPELCILETEAVEVHLVGRPVFVLLLFRVDVWIYVGHTFSSACILHFCIKRTSR